MISRLQQPWNDDYYYYIDISFLIFSSFLFFFAFFCSLQRFCRKTYALGKNRNKFNIFRGKNKKTFKTSRRNFWNKIVLPGSVKKLLRTIRLLFELQVTRMLDWSTLCCRVGDGQLFLLFFFTSDYFLIFLSIVLLSLIRSISWRSIDRKSVV